MKWSGGGRNSLFQLVEVNVSVNRCIRYNFWARVHTETKYTVTTSPVSINSWHDSWGGEDTMRQCSSFLKIVNGMKLLTFTASSERLSWVPSLDARAVTLNDLQSGGFKIKFRCFMCWLWQHFPLMIQTVQAINKLLEIMQCYQLHMFSFQWHHVMQTYKLY